MQLWHGDFKDVTSSSVHASACSILILLAGTSRSSSTVLFQFQQCHLQSWNFRWAGKKYRTAGRLVMLSLDPKKLKVIDSTASLSCSIFEPWKSTTGSFHRSPWIPHLCWRLCCWLPPFHEQHPWYLHTLTNALPNSEEPRDGHAEQHTPCRWPHFHLGHSPSKMQPKNHSWGTLAGSRFEPGNDHRWHCQCAVAISQALHWARWKRRGHDGHQQLPRTSAARMLKHVCL